VAVRLRMRRMGSHKRPFYRLVAADTRYQRDGRFLEILGYYDPKKEPYVFKVDKEKVLTWLHRGALMSPTTENLLRKEGIVQAFNLEKAETKKSRMSETVAGESVENAQ
jgi:small subunit ribosomal protein S16